MSQDSRDIKRLSGEAGKWFGWIAILIGVIGFFVEPIWLGLIALVLASVGVASPQKGLNWIGMAIGIIALIIGFL